MGKAKRGHSKDGFAKVRSDCPLVTLAMALDGSGFPRRSRVFAADSNISANGRRQLSWPPGDNYLGRWEAGKFWCQLLMLLMLSLVSLEGLPASEASLA